MALTAGAAVHSLAAVAERRKIARIAGRPAAGACRQVDDGEAAVDRLLIGEIGSERYPPSIVSAAATSIRAASVLGIAHWALEFEEAPGLKRGCDAPQVGTESRFSRECRTARVVAARQLSAFSGQAIVYHAGHATAAVIQADFFSGGSPGASKASEVGNLAL